MEATYGIRLGVDPPVGPAVPLWWKKNEPSHTIIQCSHLPLQHSSLIPVWIGHFQLDLLRCQGSVLCTDQCRLVSTLQIEAAMVECRADRGLHVSILGKFSELSLYLAYSQTPFVDFLGLGKLISEPGRASCH